MNTVMFLPIVILSFLLLFNKSSLFSYKLSNNIIALFCFIILYISLLGFLINLLLEYIY